jgi:hypothetical protein
VRALQAQAETRLNGSAKDRPDHPQMAKESLRTSTQSPQIRDLAVATIFGKLGGPFRDSVSQSDIWTEAGSRLGLVEQFSQPELHELACDGADDDFRFQQHRHFQPVIGHIDRQLSLVLEETG